MNIVSSVMRTLRVRHATRKNLRASGPVALIAVIQIAAVPLCHADTVTAVDDFYTTTEGTPLIVPPGGLLSNDSTSNPPLQALDVTGPSHGGFVIGPGDTGSSSNGGWNGGFTYAPFSNFIGMDTLTYEDEDVNGKFSNVATVHIDVIAPVPIPASGWLLLSVLGGMGLLVSGRGEQSRQAIGLTRR